MKPTKEEAANDLYQTRIDLGHMRAILEHASKLSIREDVSAEFYKKVALVVTEHLRRGESVLAKIQTRLDWFN